MKKVIFYLGCLMLLLGGICSMAGTVIKAIEIYNRTGIWFSEGMIFDHYSVLVIIGGIVSMAIGFVFVRVGRHG